MPLTGDSDATIRRLKHIFAACSLVFVVVLTLALSLGAGVDAYLAIVIGVVLVILVAVNTYVVALWADPSDQSASLYQMVLIIVALTIAEAAVLCLPLDVANNGGSLQCHDQLLATSGASSRCGNLDMTTLWTVVIALIFFFVVVLLPLSIFHYEAYDEVAIQGKRTTGCAAVVAALKSEAYVVVAAALVLGLMWGLLGTAQVPVTVLKMEVGASGSVWANQKVLQADLADDQGRADFTSRDLYDAEVAEEACISDDCYAKTSGTLEVDTSFFVYAAALTGWVGWFFFVIFGGIGLAALPIDLVRAYFGRPKVKSPAALNKMHKALQEKTKELIKLGGEMKRQREDPATVAAAQAAGWRERSKRKAEDRTNVNKFKQMVFLLERDVEVWQVCRGVSKDYNPLWPYAALLLGVLSGTLTVLWIVHVILYLLVDPPAANFLNDYFIQFSSWFDLFGIISVGIFAGYLYVCVMAGVFKVGVRCFCMELHPMRLGKTLSNAFLFNSLWLLLCAIPVVMFCADAFASYARFTSIGVLVGVQMTYLPFFNAFFEHGAFVYCLVVIFGLSLLALLKKPEDTAADTHGLKRAVRSRR